MTTITTYREKVRHDVNTLPDEYLPYLLQLVQTFRESITLKPAAASLHHGWHEARINDMAPVDTLWDGIDAE